VDDATWPGKHMPLRSTSLPIHVHPTTGGGQTLQRQKVPNGSATAKAVDYSLRR
jgi:hypothetical protein